MITYEKPYQTQAHIHSLGGAMDEITVLGEDMSGSQRVYIVNYNGVKCTAIFNFFTCTYYADDKYGRLQL
jgi:hypothetical protein